MFDSLINSIVNSVAATGEFGLGLFGLINQLKANQQAHEDQMYFYEDQKKWNSPENQMNLRRAAGLNVYGGDYPVGSVGQPTPINMAQGVPEAVNSLVGTLSRSADRKFGMWAEKLAFDSLKLQEKQVELQTKQTDNQIRLTDQQAAKLRSETVYQDLINEVYEQTKPYGIFRSKLEVQELLNRIVEGGIRNQYLPQQLQADIGFSTSQKLLNDYQRTSYLPTSLGISKAQMEAMADYYSKLGKQAEASADDIKFKKQYLKEMHQRIDKMKDGTAKSILQALMILVESGFNPIPGK